jgi:hypothetical protein
MELTVPAVFGLAYSLSRMFRATGSIRFEGMTFPANGRPVVGS